MRTPGPSSAPATSGTSAASRSERRLARLALVVAAATVLSYAGGLAIGVPALLPVLNTLAAFPVMLRLLRARDAGGAILLMLVWAAAMGVTATALSYWRTPEMERLVVNGAAYRREMFAWVLTGEGAESDPGRFVPLHLAHLAVFAGLSLASGSVLSMPMGAVLMNYMGHYVGSLAAASASPALTAALGWHPWSLVRIASFVVLGVLLAGPVLSRVAGFSFRLRDYRGWLALAAAGLVIDVALKWILAPAWQELLKGVVGWA